MRCKISQQISLFQFRASAERNAAHSTLLLPTVSNSTRACSHSWLLLPMGRFSAGMLSVALLYSELRGSYRAHPLTLICNSMLKGYGSAALIQHLHKKGQLANSLKIADISTEHRRNACSSQATFKDGL